jgi:hypothetical protein
MLGYRLSDQLKQIQTLSNDERTTILKHWYGKNLAAWDNAFMENVHELLSSYPQQNAMEQFRLTLSHGDSVPGLTSLHVAHVWDVAYIMLSCMPHDDKHIVQQYTTMSSLLQAEYPDFADHSLVMQHKHQLLPEP